MVVVKLVKETIVNNRKGRNMATSKASEKLAFVINSNDTYRPGYWREMLNKRVACTGGNIKFGNLLKKLVRGSRLFLYVNKVGVVAEGIVTSEWNGRSNEPPLVWNKKEWKGWAEYTVGVEWRTKGTQAVSAKELNRIGHRQVRLTLVRVAPAVADEISARL